MVFRLSFRLLATACAGFAVTSISSLAEAKGFGGGVRGGGFVVAVGRGQGGHAHWGGGLRSGGHWGHRRWHHGHWDHGRFGRRGLFHRGYGYGGLPYYGSYGGTEGYGPPAYPLNALSVGQPTVGIAPSPVLPPAIYVIGDKSGRGAIGRGPTRKGAARAGTVVVRSGR
jgi:hypothetical protein